MELLIVEIMALLQLYFRLVIVILWNFELSVSLQSLYFPVDFYLRFVVE